MSKKGRLNFLCQQCDTDISTVFLSSNFPVESLLYLHELCTVKKIRIIRLVKYFFVTTCQVLFLSGYEGLFFEYGAHM